jgi:GMP synthase (glutamine-hydrolysing)
VTDKPTVVVVDFGAQYAQLIARRIREAGVFSTIVSCETPTNEILKKNPAAIVLSGGPASVYEPNAPRLDPALLDAGVPTLGICYGFQAMVQALGGEVSRSAAGEYGATTVSVTSGSKLLAGWGPKNDVWMSHRDSATKAPQGFDVTASTAVSQVAAIENVNRKLAGVQFHPEVIHTDGGQQVLVNFLTEFASLRPSWRAGDQVGELVARVKGQIGDGRAICGLSGGVDSAVAAAIVQRAIGERLTCVFVDHGLLRARERQQVEKDFVAATGVKLVVVDASETFLSALSGVSGPEQKRKIIGREFVRTFESTAGEIAKSQEGAVEFLVQGTLYPDLVESGSGKKTATIKSHHNVGGIPEDMLFKLVEPLAELFKDEVRELGRALGLPPEIVNRHPFPGPGLAIRIVGAVDQRRLDTVRAADAIVRDELVKFGLESSVWQFPVVLLADVRSVGVSGDGRTYGHPVVLRPVTSEDAMTADWAKLPNEFLTRVSNRITNEVDGVNRVTLDLTSKPPGTIEWE